MSESKMLDALKSVRDERPKLTAPTAEKLAEAIQEAEKLATKNRAVEICSEIAAYL